MQVVKVRLSSNILEVVKTASGLIRLKADWSPKHYVYLDVIGVSEGDYVLAGAYNSLTYGVVTGICKDAEMEDLINPSLKPIYARLDQEKLGALMRLRHFYEKARLQDEETDPMKRHFRQALDMMGSESSLFKELIPPKRR